MTACPLSAAPMSAGPMSAGLQTGIKIRRHPAGKTLVVITVIIILLLSYVNAQSQDYRFQVPAVEFDVMVNPDASATLKYKIQFKNEEGAHRIDIIDIGLPTENYNIKGMKAFMNGVQQTRIEVSEYVSPGVEVRLLSKSRIEPLESGTFEFEARIPDLVFEDTTRDDYASFQITPTWFGSQFVTGSSRVTIRVHLPPGLKADEILYQSMPYKNKFCEGDRCTAVWEARYNFSQSYLVGISFPDRVMNKVIDITIFDLIEKWYEANRTYITAIVVLIAIFLLSFATVRAFGCGGWIFVVFEIFLMLILSIFIGIWSYILLPAGAVTLVEYLRHKRKRRYLPAIASVEGAGIKRGLTAPEAAVLLERKPEQVIAMVIFGLMKKAMIEQELKDPEDAKKNPSFTVPGDYPENVTLHKYEEEFLRIIETKHKRSSKPARIRELNFEIALKSMGKQVAAKMAGFDVDETRRYYEQIVSRAWKEVQEGGVHPDESWQRKMDEKVDWLLLDDNFATRFRPYRDVYVPASYRSSGRFGSYSGPLIGNRSSGGSGVSAPRFTDIAGSVAGWMENTAGSLSSSLGVSGPLHALKFESSGGGGRRGGGGGGCACACAGCACACACAGGGR